MRIRAVIPIVATGVLLCLAGCSDEVHSAQWWMGHGPELQAKLTECKKYPSMQTTDNCRNATEAFVTLVQATAQQQPAAGTPSN